MSWGIYFKPEIYLSRQSYSSKGEVEDRINEINKEINNCEAELKMFASANPKDIVPPDSIEEQIFWLNDQINGSLDVYKELLADRHNLELYLEYLDDGGEIVKSE
jgi:predicted DNA-binding protein YlxM (UPF0122 family)